ncbi:MAG: hypothetical protein K2X39_08020 [Silvanigrellaceae bacterium]|nr:hypothetical protein [Silvanigrellaceae bacterium]
MQVVNNTYKSIICFLLMVICFGIPIDSFAKFFFLLISATLYFHSKVNISNKNIIILTFVTLFLKILSLQLPSLHIEEGHQIFYLSFHSNGNENKILPQAFHNAMSEEFLSLYPKEKWNTDKIAGGTWEYYRPVEDLFASSADGYFQNKRYSRVTKQIDFNSLPTFRISTVNNLNLNFWISSSLKREEFPFYVFYEWDKSALGGQLCISGEGVVAYSESHKSIVSKTLYSEKPYCQKILNSDLGKKYWIGVFPKKNSFHVWFEPSATLYWINALYQGMIWCLAIVILLLSLSKHLYLGLSVSMISLLLVLMASLSSKLNNLLGVAYLSYHVYEGGDDPLTFEGMGLYIANALSHFQYYDALKSSESIYYYQPGYRYFKALFRIFFGARTFEFFLSFYLFMIAILKILKLIFNLKNIFHIFGLLCSLGLIYFAKGKTITDFYEQYAFEGTAESLGCPLFLFGIYLLLSQIKVKEISKTRIFWGALLLTQSVIIRPNFLFGWFFCLLILFFILLKDKQFSSLIYLSLGSLPILLPMLHNYYFGNQFFIFTSSSTIPQNLHLQPNIYISFIKNLLTFQFNGEEYQLIQNMIDRWMFGKKLNYVCVALVCLMPFFSKNFIPKKGLYLSLIAIGLYIPSLFYLNYFRLTYLSWIITYILVGYLIAIFFEKFKNKILAK